MLRDADSGQIDHMAAEPTQAPMGLTTKKACQIRPGGPFCAALLARPSGSVWRGVATPIPTHSAAYPYPHRHAPAAAQLQPVYTRHTADSTLTAHLGGGSSAGRSRLCLPATAATLPPCLLAAGLPRQGVCPLPSALCLSTTTPAASRTSSSLPRPAAVRRGCRVMGLSFAVRRANNLHVHLQPLQSSSYPA